MYINKTLAVAFGMVLMGVAPAVAGCLHEGVVYSAGAEICTGGWLMACTVADYWSATGYC